MNVNLSQAVNIWALRQSLAMSQVQAVAPVTTQIVNNLASLDPNLGRMIDISI